jgi:hypothetical protein
MVDVTQVEVVRDRVVLLRFSDGTEREVDLYPFLWGPAFDALLKDESLFRQVRVDSDTGTISWPNGADLDPDVLHGDFLPASKARSHR